MLIWKFFSYLNRKHLNQICPNRKPPLLMKVEEENLQGRFLLFLFIIKVIALKTSNWLQKRILSY